MDLFIVLFKLNPVDKAPILKSSIIHTMLIEMKFVLMLELI